MSLASLCRTTFYGMGWKSRSGKKKLKTAQVEKATETETTARTGARERYCRKAPGWLFGFCID
jgi:hypothetical protein